MSGIVRTDQTVIDSIAKMQRIIAGELQTAIDNLNREGVFLAEGGKWLGKHHDDFVPTWQSYSKNLVNMQKSLQELKDKVDQINKAIMAAGGNM